MLQVGRSDAVWNLWEAIQKSKLGLFHLRTRSDIFDCVVRGLVGTNYKYVLVGWFVVCFLSVSSSRLDTVFI